MLPDRPSGPEIDPSSEVTKLVRSQAPASGAGCRYSSTSSGIADRPALAAAPVEDQLHRVILARRRTRSACGTIARMDDGGRPSSPLTELLRLPAGPVDLADLDPAGTPGFTGKKADAPAATEALAPELGDLQERLYAVGPDRRRSAAPKILMVLQGMDTSGKGGAIRHAIGLVDPQGVRIKAFKAPTEEERSARTTCGGSSARCRARA